jgi:23S rRNA pseudouridine1911/1915/1917 synthase
MKKTSVCFLNNFPSVAEGIFSLTKCSKSRLKKLKISKNFLQKPIKYRDEIELPINLLNSGQINPLYSGGEVKILSREKDFVAISKPAKIHTHPLCYDESDNLLSFLRFRGEKDLLNINKDSYDRGLLYRLDFETSGLILYATNERVYAEVRDNFSKIAKTKKYRAVVIGKCNSKQDLKHFLNPSGIKNKLIKASDSFEEGSLESVLNIELIEYSLDMNLSLIEVELFEGHRHQIRAQMAAYGFPILGDPLYSKSESERMFLHCHSYTLEYNNEILVFKDKTPQSFLNLFGGNS